MKDMTAAGGDARVTRRDSDAIQASVLHGPGDLRIETRTITAPGPDELQISIRSTGLCGSDLHYYNDGRNGDIVMQEPLTLGHESAGIVITVGVSVIGFAIGDKVALEVGVPCGECDRCSEGRYNICKGVKFRSSARSFPHYEGTLQERINHPAAWCHKLPGHVSLDLGALLEPLSVAIHANRRAALSRDSRILVFGAGTVGLLAAAMAKIDGASDVIIADIDQGRVDFAVEHGFANVGYTMTAQRGENIDENLKMAKETAAGIAKVGTQGEGELGEFDAVFECTGVPSCVQAAIYATRPGGKVMLIGMGTPVYTLPVSAAALREVDLCGVFRYANTYSEGVEVLSDKYPKSSKMPDFSKLITHRYEGLRSIKEAFEVAGKTKDKHGSLVLKAIIALNDTRVLDV